MSFSYHETLSRTIIMDAGVFFSKFNEIKFIMTTSEYVCVRNGAI